jgi:hypothetical protein
LAACSEQRMGTESVHKSLERRLIAVRRAGAENQSQVSL